MAGAQLDLRLPASEQAPELARRRVVERFGGELDPRQLEDARLLTSELVTNAVVHGRGPVGLIALLDEDRLMIEVVDQGDGFERAVRDHGVDAVGGNGLNIVEALASRWGIHPGSSHVWFELERPGPRLGPDAQTQRVSRSSRGTKPDASCARTDPPRRRITGPEVPARASG